MRFSPFIFNPNSVDIKFCITEAPPNLTYSRLADKIYTTVISIIRLAKSSANQKAIILMSVGYKHSGFVLLNLDAVESSVAFPKALQALPDFMPYSPC